MVRRGEQRCADILQAVDNIERLLDGQTLESLKTDNHALAAFERYLEIVSEASRHVPDKLKLATPHIQWKNIANLGNHIRHAYSRVEAEILWNIRKSGKLAELREACEAYIKALPQS